MITFFLPHSVTLLSVYSDVWITFYNILAILRCLIAALSVTFIVLKRKQPNILVKTVALYELAIFVSCYFNGTLTFRFTITNCITYIGLACFLQMQDEKKSDKLLDGLVLFFGILTLLGAISIIIFPNGFNDAKMKSKAIYFLGSKNSGFFYFVIYIYLKIHQQIRNKRGYSHYLIFVSAIFAGCSLITNSMNGFITMFFIFMFIVISKYRFDIRKLFKPRFAVISIMIFAALIPFLASGKLEWIFNAIGRESNFSMRTYIWNSAIELIRISPIWGNGKDGDVILYKGQTQAHNIYLDYAAKYGLITLGIFIAMLVTIAYKMARNTKKELVYINSFFFFAMFFHSLLDSVTMSFIVLLLFYCQYDRKFYVDGVKLDRMDFKEQKICRNIPKMISRPIISTIDR